MGGAYFVWGKGKTVTKNLNLNFGANPKNPQLIELVLPSKITDVVSHPRAFTKETI